MAELPAQLATLTATLAAPSGDFAARRLAHQLKGDAATYGLPELAHVAGELEDLLADGNRPAGRLLAALHVIGRRVVDGAGPRGVPP